jgi:hypothetical protein
MLEQQGRLPAHHLERVSHYQVDEYMQYGRKRVKTGQNTWMDVGLDFRPLDARSVKLADRLQEFETRNHVGVYVYTWEERDGTTALAPYSADHACAALLHACASLSVSSCSTRTTSCG